MKIRPLQDRILVKRIEEEEKTKGGIIIPDTAKEKPMQGEVIAVGPGARNEKGEIVALDVKAGDKVLFGKWSGTEVKLDGEDLLIEATDGGVTRIEGYFAEGTPPDLVIGGAVVPGRFVARLAREAGEGEASGGDDLLIGGNEEDLLGGTGEPAEAQQAALAEPAGEAQPVAEITETEVIDHVRGRIANFKVPKSVEVRTEPLPLSGAMKVLKRELRAPYWEGRDRAID